MRKLLNSLWLQVTGVIAADMIMVVVILPAILNAGTPGFIAGVLLWLLMIGLNTAFIINRVLK